MDAKGEAKSFSCWSWEQNKAFEIALATYTEDGIDQWEKIAAAVPGKTIEEIKCHYDLLVEDINNIESGLVPLPDYTMDLTNLADDDGKGKMVGQPGNSSKKGKRAKGDQERRKGQAWTLDEHRLFLLGLEKYGKGDWRSISRNCVLTRTPIQVASHAQKYFIRQNSVNRTMRRTSILDINDADSEDLSTSGEPITVTSAFGTPVDLPVCAAEQMSNGMGASVSGSEVSAAPNDPTLMTCSMSCAPAH